MGERWASLFHLITILPQSVCLPKQVLESISGTLECGQFCTNILNIYQPPATTSFSEFQDILPYTTSLPQDLALMGHFNLHMNSSPDNRQLTDILESSSLCKFLSTHSTWLNS